MIRILFILFKVLIITVSCSSLKPVNHLDMTAQGIEGHVYRVSGNRMPSPDRKLSPPTGVKTFLYIYALTNLNQVSRVDGSSLFFNIRTKMITKVETDSNGYFKVNLKPGHYSLFTKKDDHFFANLYDKDNNIAPVEVVAGKMTKVDFTIDYDAVY
jgi:hypothetical protein